MSTKIDRSSPATPSVPTAPAEPVKPAEAPKPAGKADVETGIVQDVVERGESFINAGKALFGVVEKKVTDVVVDKAADVALGVGSGVASAKRSVADLQADASRAIDKAKPALIEAAHAQPLSIGKTLLHDLATKGVDGVLKEQFKQLSPTIADPAKVAQTLSRAGELVEERLAGVGQELRHAAVGELIDISQKLAQPLTLKDLERPMTDARRVLAETVKAGGDLVDEVSKDGFFKTAARVVVAGADAVATVGGGLRDAAKLGEDLITGKAVADVLGVDYTPPFVTTNLPILNLFRGIQDAVGLAEKISEQGDKIEGFINAMTPGSFKERAQSLVPGQTLVTTLGTGFDVKLGPSASVNAKAEVKIACEEGTPPVYTLELGVDRGGSAGIGFGSEALNEAVGAGATAGGAYKLTYKVAGRENLDKLLDTLYARGLSLPPSASDLKGVLSDDIQFEEASRVGLESSLAFIGAKIGDKREAVWAKTSFTDKQTGQPSATSYKASVAYETGGGIGSPIPVQVKLPDVPGEQGEALRQQIAKGMQGGSSLLNALPTELITRALEINGNRTDLAIKVAMQGEVMVKLPKDITKLGDASEMSISASVQLEVGNTNLEGKIEMSIKNPAALFKAFAGKLDPDQLVAAMRAGTITHEDIQRQVNASGFKASDVFSLKVSATEKTMNSVGLDIGVASAEHGIQTSTTLASKDLVSGDASASTRSRVGRLADTLPLVFKG